MNAIPDVTAMAGQDERRSRRLLLLERTMYRDGLTPFTSVFVVSVRGNLNEARLRQVFAKVQAKHPLLRCVVDEAAGVTRLVEQSEPAPIPLRIVERNTAFDWEKEARREWIAPFGSTSDPLVRFVWLRGSDVHELMLVAHHCICDGPSGIALLRDCFAAYDDPQWELDTYDSFGAIEDLVPEWQLRSRAFQLRVRARAALFRLALFLKARRRPRSTSGPAPDEMYFHRWQLDVVETERLTAFCRAEHVTILAAVGVAFLLAFREVRGTRALTHAYAMVNARTFLPKLPPDALFGIAPGVEIQIKGLTSEVKPFTDAFWERARTFRKDLTTRLDRLGSRLYETLAASEKLHDLYPRLIADTEAATAVRHVTFSNLGRLDLQQEYRNFRVESVYSPLVMVSPSPANTVVLSGFAGALECCIISDKQSLPKADAFAIQKKIMAILRAATGIAPQDESNFDEQISVEREATL